MMASLGYERTLAKLGQLKRFYIRREWSFIFDCITKAFANKCSNFDAIPIFSQQIGYALINQTDFDYASVVLGFIGDRMIEDRNIVYFARFCQLIYSFCCDNKPQSASELISSFKLAKRAFNDLLSTDNKKVVLRPLQVPIYVKQALITYDPVKYTELYPDVQPSEPHPSAPTTSTQPPQTSQPQPLDPIVQPSSSKPKRTKKVPQTQQKRRRFILRDESDAEEQVSVLEPVIREAEKVSFQEDVDIGSSRPLKRLRKHNSDKTAHKVSLKAKRFKTLAKRPENSGKGMEAAAKEGDHESLISQDSVEAHNSPSADPDPHATHHSPLHEP